MSEIVSNEVRDDFSRSLEGPQEITFVSVLSLVLQRALDVGGVVGISTNQGEVRISKPLG